MATITRNSAQRIRKMLSTADLPDAWGPSGPTQKAIGWLAGEDKPGELTDRQWTVLLLVWTIWDACGYVPARRPVRLASLSIEMKGGSVLACTTL